MSVTMAMNTLPSMIDTNYKSSSPPTMSSKYDNSDDEEINGSAVEHMDSASQDSNSMVERPSMISDRPSMLLEPTFVDRPSMLLKEVKEDDLDESNSNDSNFVPKVQHKRGKRKKYQKYTPEDRIAIGKYCFEHGPAAARKAFQDRYPEMSESVTRGFRDKYKQMIGEFAVYEYEQKRQREMQSSYISPPRGRPRKYKVKESEMKPAEEEIHSPASSPNEHKPEYETRQREKSGSRGQSPFEEKYDLREAEEKAGVTLVKFSIEDELRIGCYCSHHGVMETLHEFHREYPGIREGLIVEFHKKYQRRKYDQQERQDTATTAPSYVSPSHGREYPSPSHTREYPSPGQPQVFVLEGDQVAITASSTTTTISSHSQSEQRNSNQHSPASSTKESTLSPVSTRSFTRENSRSPPPQRRYEKSDRVYRHRSRSPPPRISPPGLHQTTSVIASSHYAMVAPPIIHYPRPRPHSPRQYSPPRTYNGQLHRTVSDDSRLNREPVAYVKMNGFASVGYPYDRKDFDHRPSSTSASHGRSKRFKYQKYTPEDRYSIGKLCNDIGLGATVKVYREQFPRLNESVVRTFRNKYRELLEKGNGRPVTEAIERKPSRRSISTLMEGEVVSHLKELRSSQVELTENFVLAVARNIIATKHQKNADHMYGILTTEWANTLLWKHKLLDNHEPIVINAQGVCCERCNTKLVCPKCP